MTVFIFTAMTMQTNTMVVNVPEVEPDRDQSKIMTDEHTFTEGQTPQPDRNEESGKVSSNEN